MGVAEVINEFYLKIQMQKKTYLNSTGYKLVQD